MGQRTVRAGERDSLARFLGWFSVGLGSAQVAAPGAMCRLVGAGTDGRAPLVMRLMGARELAHGVTILTRPQPRGWVRTRVAGDALDLALLGLVAARNPDRRARTAFAIANVVPIAVADVYESVHPRADGDGARGKPIRKAVTIRRTRNDVERAWEESELRLRVEQAGATVELSEAPGNRGTELAVEWVEAPRAGELGRAFRKLSGSDLATELSDGLRRFKQELETGEVMRSDAVPQGHELSEQATQRPAQPVEEGVR